MLVITRGYLKLPGVFSDPLDKKPGILFSHPMGCLTAGGTPPAARAQRWVPPQRQKTRPVKRDHSLKGDGQVPNVFSDVISWFRKIP